jgi:hypothetical protein
MQLWGEIDTPLWYLTTLTTWHSSHVELFVLALYILFCKARTQDDGEWQDPHNHLYLHTCSVLMSSLPFTSYLKNTNENFQKIPFLMHSSHKQLYT